MASGSSAEANALDDSSVTMLDVLNIEKEMEEDCAAVLGGSDEKNCTYSQGPVKRQALYSCLTCLPESKDDFLKGAGVCLACSYACHENHELVELYTKRNFRCDCGTPKFGRKCSLEEKSVDNDSNAYNQNFSGLYCTCHRPYPDPERENDDEMIQCVICEDWYHSLHLDAKLSPSNDFCEMICGACVSRVDFLKDYSGLAVNLVQFGDESKESLDVTSTSDLQPPEKEGPADNKDEASSSASTKTAAAEKEEDSCSDPKKRRLEHETPSSSSSALPCKRPKNPGHYEKGAIFWPDNWRQQLCVCVQCKAMYEEMQVAFLTDLEDTVKWYEDVGLKKHSDNQETDYDRGLRGLASLDRVRQIDAITAYNRMKDRLKEYLNQFVSSQQVVTEADIKRFFQQMRNEDQKDLLVHSDIPYNCR